MLAGQMTVKTLITKDLKEFETWADCLLEQVIVETN